MAGGGRIGPGRAGTRKADGVNAATERVGEMAGKPDAAGWRVVDPEAGDPVFVCPGCWPAVAGYWEERPDATVRVVGPRPDWARCGICDPAGAC